MLGAGSPVFVQRLFHLDEHGSASVLRLRSADGTNRLTRRMRSRSSTPSSSSQRKPQLADYHRKRKTFSQREPISERLRSALMHQPLMSSAGWGKGVADAGGLRAISRAGLCRHFGILYGRRTRSGSGVPPSNSPLPTPSLDIAVLPWGLITGWGGTAAIATTGWQGH